MTNITKRFHCTGFGLFQWLKLALALILSLSLVQSSNKLFQLVHHVSSVSGWMCVWLIPCSPLSITTGTIISIRISISSGYIYETALGMTVSHIFLSFLLGIIKETNRNWMFLIRCSHYRDPLQATTILTMLIDILTTDNITIIHHDCIVCTTLLPLVSKRRSMFHLK